MFSFMYLISHSVNQQIFTEHPLFSRFRSRQIVTTWMSLFGRWQVVVMNTWIQETAIREGAQSSKPSKQYVDNIKPQNGLENCFQKRGFHSKESSLQRKSEERVWEKSELIVWKGNSLKYQKPMLQFLNFSIVFCPALYHTFFF